MRILQIVHGFSPEFVGGTEAHCEELSRRLLEQGHECMVLAGSNQSAKEAALVTVDQEGLLVTRYMGTKGPARDWTEAYDPEAESTIRQFLALIRPDIVHVHHWLRLTTNLVMICADLGIPAVISLHDAWASCPRIHRIRHDGTFCTDPSGVAPCIQCVPRGTWQNEEEVASSLVLHREMMEQELTMAAALIVPSQAHAAFIGPLLKIPRDRLTVIPNGPISRATMHEGRNKCLNNQNRPLQIGHWGHLSYFKGTHMILEAVHQLRDPTAVEVHLIGSTDDVEYYRRLHELTQEIRVHFHGFYRPAELRNFDLDLAIFASIASESYSFTLDEALQCGIPVLVPNRGALPERIGEAGLTFQAGNVSDLACQLQLLLDSPDILDSLRQNISQLKRASWEDCIPMLEAIYENIIEFGPKERLKEPGAESMYLKQLIHLQRQLHNREAILAEREQEVQTERENRLKSEQENRLKSEQEREVLAMRLVEREQEVQTERENRLKSEREVQDLSTELFAIKNSRTWRLVKALRRAWIFRGR